MTFHETLSKSKMTIQFVLSYLFLPFSFSFSFQAYCLFDPKVENRTAMFLSKILRYNINNLFILIFFLFTNFLPIQCRRITKDRRLPIYSTLVKQGLTEVIF